MLTQAFILHSNPHNNQVKRIQYTNSFTNLRCYHLKLKDEARLAQTLVLFPEYSPKTRLTLPQTCLKFISTKMLHFYIPVFSSAEKKGAGTPEGTLVSGSKGIRDHWKSMFILPKRDVNATVVSQKRTKTDDLEENSSRTSEHVITYTQEWILAAA